MTQQYNLQKANTLFTKLRQCVISRNWTSRAIRTCTCSYIEWLQKNYRI